MEELGVKETSLDRRKVGGRIASMDAAKFATYIAQKCSRHARKEQDKRK
jgi:hypothetical protein